MSEDKYIAGVDPYSDGENKGKVTIIKVQNEQAQEYIAKFISEPRNEKLPFPSLVEEMKKFYNSPILKEKMIEPLTLADLESFGLSETAKNKIIDRVNNVLKANYTRLLKYEEVHMDDSQVDTIAFRFITHIYPDFIFIRDSGDNYKTDSSIIIKVRNRK